MLNREYNQLNNECGMFIQQKKRREYRKQRMFFWFVKVKYRNKSKKIVPFSFSDCKTFYSFEGINKKE
jgi:hypothetical protein